MSSPNECDQIVGFIGMREKVTESENDLYKALQTTGKEPGEINVSILTTKTKSIVIAKKKSRQCKLKLNNSTIK